MDFIASDYILEGRVAVGASVFPVTVTTNSSGLSPARFMLVRHGVNLDDWVAMAWKNSYTGPEIMLCSKVIDVVTFTSRAIDVDTEIGRVSVRSSSGGCCGNRLKNWNPFGSATLSRVAHPSEK